MTAKEDSPHILIVCTSEMVLCGLTGLFAAAGYVVTGSPDAWRARKLIEGRKFALAILDLPSDDPSAHELVRLLRQGNTRIKLLALARSDRRAQGLRLQVDDVAIKPFPPGDLLKTVTRLIGRPTGSSDRGGKNG